MSDPARLSRFAGNAAASVAATAAANASCNGVPKVVSDAALNASVPFADDAIVATVPTVIDLFLQPGEMFVGTRDYRVRTLLGSCVSITLWHPRYRIGAMSHCVLSESPRPDLTPDARYCADAFDMMTTGLRQLGVDVRQCEAKLFGGGQMFPQESRHQAQPIGTVNAAYARRLLRNAGLQIRSSHLSGLGHRQIVFDIRDGSVWVRHVRSEGGAPHYPLTRG